MSRIARFSVAAFAAVALTSVAPRLLAVMPAPQQIITTVAGGGPADGLPALDADIGSPQAVVVDGGGNLFVAVAGLNRVLRIDAATGTMTTVAGNGTRGFSGDGGPATSASLWDPRAVALDGAGNLFIADVNNRRIRRVDPTGKITTVAGNGAGGFSGDGGPATGAPLANPRGLAVDSAGNLFISDAETLRVRKVDASGTITTVAGNGAGGFSGDHGPATSASLFDPRGLAIDAAGSLFIADRSNNRIRRVDPSGTITTVAGNGVAGFTGDGGPAQSASLASPLDVAVDDAGNLFIADLNNHRLRRVDVTGTITTVAGNGTLGFSGDGGAAASAVLNSPIGVAVDGTGKVFIADAGNRRIRRVDPTGRITTTAGNGITGGDGRAATSASLASPWSVAADGAGALFIADTESQRIRRVNSGGAIATIAGDGTFGFSGDGGPATSASFRNPSGVAVDGDGNVFIADTSNQRVRRVDVTGTITTVAGNGNVGFSGDGGAATSARLSNPQGVTVDGAGNLFIADTGNQRVRRVDPSGAISTVAGDGSLGFSGDGGPATGAGLANPIGVASDRSGNLFIADSGNRRVRRVDLAGTITTVAGDGNSGFSGDGGPATGARLRSPVGVAVDGTGNLFIADLANQRIRRVDVAGTITTVAGNGTIGFSGDGGLATGATLADPRDVAVDGAGNLFIADLNNRRIRRVSAANTAPTITAAAPLERQQGSASGGAVTIATVSDVETASADLSITLGSVPAGLIIGTLVNSGGTVTAPVQSGCGATVGINIVGLQVSDGAFTTTANLTVHVTANAPPTLGVYPATVLSEGGNTVVVPASPPADNGSVNVISATASAGFTGTLTPNLATGSVVIANADPVGRHTVTVAAADNCGAITTTSFTVEVVDTAPPVIVNATPSLRALWPPNRQMVPVTIAVEVWDNVDPSPSCRVTAVTSSDPITGRGDNTSPDWVIGGGLSVSLRAERAGAGAGRIYTLTVECTDQNGNVSTAPVIVTVPHDRGAER